MTRLSPSVMTLLILAGISSAASEPQTLRQCIDRAIEVSWSARETALALERSEISLREARAKQGLSLSGSASHTLSDTPLADKDPRGVENSSSIGLSASLPLYSGGSLSAAIARTALLRESQSATSELQHRTVAAAVAAAYFAYFQWTDEADWREKTVDACDSSLARTKSLFAFGAALESDTLLAAGNCATERVSRMTALHGADRALRELKWWVDLSPDAELSLVPIDSSYTSPGELPDLSSLLDEAFRHAPELKIDSLSAAAAEENLKIARATGKAQINLTAGASTGIRWIPDHTGDELRNKYSHNIAVGLSVPILNRGATAAALDRAVLDRLQSEIDSERNARMLKEEIEELWLSRKLLAERLPAEELAMKAAHRNYIHDGERHALGKITTAELLQSQSNFESARARWQKSRWGLAENRLLIHLRTGKGLP